MSNIGDIKGQIFQGPKPMDLVRHHWRHPKEAAIVLLSETCPNCDGKKKVFKDPGPPFVPRWIDCPACCNPFSSPERTGEPDNG